VIWTEACPTASAEFGPGTDFETIEDCFAEPMEKWGEPYGAMLRFLREAGCLEGLPLDGQGIMRVSVPFCAAFMECRILVPFLAELLLGRPAVSGISVLGTDVTVFRGGKWPQKEKYASKKYPGLQLRLRQSDLSREPLPDCALTIAVHPEATRDKLWGDILANIVRSTVQGGVIVIATYFEIEMEAVINFCKPMGICFNVYENPYYKTHPVDKSPSMRFLAVARR